MNSPATTAPPSGEQLRALGVTDVVVWGLRSNTHTHHFIHRAVHDHFTETARHQKLRVHWYDDEPRTLPTRTGLGKRRTYLFFSSPHYDVDRHIPILPDAFYIAHADTTRSWRLREPITKYDDQRAAGRAVFWRVFRGFPDAASGFETISEKELTYWNAEERRLLMPWATDLTVRQIDETIDVVRDRFRRGSLFPGSTVLFVGLVWDKNRAMLDELAEASAERGLELRIDRIERTEELAAATREAFMAPAVQGAGQTASSTEFYVPCRILKNISYGALGVTNNEGVNAMLGGRLVFAPELGSLIDRYRERVDDFDQAALDEMVGVMRTVRDHHTYENRIGQCLAALVTG